MGLCCSFLVISLDGVSARLSTPSLFKDAFQRFGIQRHSPPPGEVPLLEHGMDNLPDVESKSRRLWHPDDVPEEKLQPALRPGIEPGRRYRLGKLVDTSHRGTRPPLKRRLCKRNHCLVPFASRGKRPRWEAPDRPPLRRCPP